MIFQGNPHGSERVRFFFLFKMLAVDCVDMTGRAKTGATKPSNIPLIFEDAPASTHVPPLWTIVTRAFVFFFSVGKTVSMAIVLYFSPSWLEEGGIVILNQRDHRNRELEIYIWFVNGQK